MFSTILFTHPLSELCPMISPSRYSMFVRPTRPALPHLLKASTVMQSTQSLSTPLLRLFWQPDPQTRPSDCGICETSRRNSTRLRVTPILFSQSPGIRLRSPFWPVPAMIAKLCSGILAEQAKNRLQKMRRMALPNCMTIAMFLSAYSYRY